MADRWNTDPYAQGWCAGLEQARRIIQQAEDRRDALERIRGLLAEAAAPRRNRKRSSA